MNVHLEIRDLHASVTDAAGEAREVLRGVNLTVSAGRRTRSWGRTGRARRRCLCHRRAPRYQVTQGSITWTARTADHERGRRARAGLFWHAVPGRGARRLGGQLPADRVTASAARRQAAHLVKELNAAMASLAMDRRSPSATSTRASPAARRSGTRSCSCSCSTPRSRSWTKPTPASISTRCGCLGGINRFRADQEHGVLLITHYTGSCATCSPTSCTSSSAARSSPRAAPSCRGAGDQRVRAFITAGRRHDSPAGLPAARRPSCRRWTPRRSGRISDPGRAVPRPPLIYWTPRHLAQARQVPTPSATSTRCTTRRRTAARTCWARRRPTPTRARGCGCRVHRRRPRRDRLHQEPTEALNWWPTR